MDKGVSIIIPCYYKWDFVEECLDSVFQQKKCGFAGNMRA